MPTQPSFDFEAAPLPADDIDNSVVSPALERGGIENVGGFLTPYYLFDLLERYHTDELGPDDREASRITLKRLFRDVQKQLVDLVFTDITLERTETLWYRELFQLLGFLNIKKLDEPLETERRGFVPISHVYTLGEGDEAQPLILIDLHPFKTDLDKDRYPNPYRDTTITDEPISRALEFALDYNQARWALLSNGIELRLYRRGGSVARQYLKVDFTKLFERENAKDWLVFWGLFRLAAFLPTEQTDDTSMFAQRCLLDKVIDESQRHATQIADDLRQNVVNAVENMLQGIIDSPDNRHIWLGMLNGRATPDETQLKKLFEESIYFLYRLLFVLYAESRDLLPLGASSLYKETYSLEHLRDIAGKPIRPEDYEKTYYIETLRTLFTMLYKGYPFRNPAVTVREGSRRVKDTTRFRIPPYNGRLFDPERTRFLDECHIPDRAMREVIRELSLSRPKRRSERRERYSYADLGVDQLGSIYEGLLVYEPSIAQDAMVEVQIKKDLRLIPQEQADEYSLHYDNDSKKPAGSFILRLWGGRRKGSGSYYTPQEITAFLVKDALAPLVEPIVEGCGQRDEHGNPLRRADEILNLKVCDPAMGSGAFLVQACRYLGEAYGRAIIAEEQRENKRIASTELSRYKRRVAEKCLYGVDANILAVELAKVSLWLETLAQDRPLTFLDAHLRHGNSLIGAPLRNRDGEFDVSMISILPVEAYTKVAKIDSKAYGKLLDKRKADNSKEIKKIKQPGLIQQQSLFGGDIERYALAEYERQRLQLDESDEDKSLEDAVALVHRKQNLLQAALSGDESKIRPFKDLCDLWCAVWFWPLDATLLPPTTITYRDIAALLFKQEGALAPQNADDYLAMAQKIYNEQHFFHWELEFPEVWCDEQGNFRPDGGFDAIIGNPPWSKIAPNSKEFWSNFLPTFSTLGKQAAVRAAENLRNNDPDADKQWRSYFKRVRQQGELFKYEDVFAWQGKGQINTYKLFVERMLWLTKLQGVCNLVLPASIYTDEGCTTLRDLLFFQQKARFVFSLENRGGIFPIDSRFKVVLLSEHKTNTLVSHEEQENENEQKTIDCLFLVGKGPDGHDLAPSSEELGLLLPQLNRYLLRIPATVIETLAPDTRSLMEFKSQREVDLVTNIYSKFPPLGAFVPGSWNVSFTRELDMTNGSHYFRDGKRLEDFGAVKQRGRTWQTPPEEWYQNPPDEWREEHDEPFVFAERVVHNGTLFFPEELDENEVQYTHRGYLLESEASNRQALPIVPDETYVPLYEGRMVHQFDHVTKAYVRGNARSAEWRSLDFDQKEIIPHYFVAMRDWTYLDVRAGFCGITGQTNERSLLTSMIPASFPCGNSVPTVNIAPDDVRLHLLWVAITNSFIVDWLLRLRVSNNINFFVLEALALPRLRAGDENAQELIKCATQLICVTPEFAGLWQEIIGDQWEEPYSTKDVRERARLRAIIDALVADIYGLSEHDFAYILSTFPLLDRDQPALPGEASSFITRDIALLMLFQRRGIAPPQDIVTFFAETGVDIRQRTGPIIDLVGRVRVAQELGAVAYLPSRREREDRNNDSDDEQEELDFDEDEDL